MQIDPRALELGCAHRTAAHSPDRRSERGDGVGREPEYLADLADGRTAAIGDDGCRNAGMVASIVPVNVLNHFLAAFVLEIHIDIGRLAAIGGDKPLEQQAAVARVNIGDVKAVADGRVCSRATALTQDVLPARVSHDGMDREKIRRVIEIADQLQLMLESLTDIVGNPLGIAGSGALPRKMNESFLRSSEPAAALIGIFMAQFIQ